ncbi:MAG: bacillithiol system redox-active protein YtxJ [Chitinophagaceae bacterium]
MDWIIINSPAQLEEIREKSKTKPQVIFKHSTRCAISSMAKSRLEKGKKPDNIDFYYLDLIHFRSLSTKLSDDFNVWHESPQVLLIKDGTCIYDESHSAIRMEDILKKV